MKLKSVLLAGVAAALSAAMLTPAIADDAGGRTHYDDQADETRALNMQALEAARGQAGTTMSEPDDEDDVDDQRDGQGGPEFEGPPNPDDLGVSDDDDQQDDADDVDDDTAPDDGPR
jgi:hypothetical protein